MLIHDENRVCGASFPDFPGAATVAQDLDTLYVKAAGMLADGEAVPPLRTLREMRGDPAFLEASAGAMIGLIHVDPPGRAVRVGLPVEESVPRRIDRAAALRGETRPGFLVAAATARLSEGAAPGR